jgi:hypothetical protein
MGCDIHVAVQKKTANGYVTVKTECKWWEMDYDEEDRYTIEVIDCARDYALFGILSGVRNRDMPRMEAAVSGLPENVDGYTEKEVGYLAEYHDYHSHTWLEMADLERVHADPVFEYEEEWEGKINKYTPLKDFYKTVRDELDYLLPGVPDEDIRIIVYYDN